MSPTGCSAGGHEGEHMFLYIQYPGLMLLALERIFLKLTEGASAPVWLKTLWRYQPEHGVWKYICVFAKLALTFVAIAVFYNCFLLLVEDTFSMDVVDFTRAADSKTELFVYFIATPGLMVGCGLLSIGAANDWLRSLWRVRHTHWWVMGEFSQGFCRITRIFETDLQEAQNPYPGEVILFNVPKNKRFGHQSLKSTNLTLRDVTANGHNGNTVFTLEDARGNILRNVENLQLLSMLKDVQGVTSVHPSIAGLLAAYDQDRARHLDYLRNRFVQLEGYFRSAKTTVRDKAVAEWLKYTSTVKFHGGKCYPEDFPFPSGHPPLFPLLMDAQDKKN